MGKNTAETIHVEKYLSLQELSQINEPLCALFDEYSRLSVTLQYHRENGSLHTNLTLLVLIAEKLLTDACEYYVESDLVMSSFLWESSVVSH